MDPEPEAGTSSSFLPPTKDSKFLRFFQKTAEELVGWLACTLHPRYPVSFLHENLVDRLIEQVEMLSWIDITFEASDAQLFPDEVDAISYIVGEVYEELVNKPWIMGASCMNEGILCYITYAVMYAFTDYTRSFCKAARMSPDTDDLEEGSQGEPEMQGVCSTVLSRRSPSECSELIRELGGSPDSTDLSDDECSEILTGFQTYTDSLVKRAIRSVMTGAECPLEAWPDSSSSIPAVQVTEASKDSEVEIIEDLKVPACGNDTTDSTTTGTKKKWKKLRARISSFVRRVFCCGCRSSRRVVPL